MNWQKRTQVAVILSVLLLLSQPSWAHKIRIFAWETGEGTISTEAKFSGGRAAQNAKVSVIDEKTQQELASGTTNEEGIYTFPIPTASSGELQIVIDGGDGHKNYWKHTLSTKESPPAQAAVTTAEPAPAAAPEQEKVQATAPSSAPQPGLNQEELANLIETALDKKLAPIRKSLAEESDKGPSLQDIIGGIGYIFGLAGMAAYVQARRNNREKK